MKQALFALCLAVVLTSSSAASAHQDDARGDHTHGTIPFDYTRNRSPQYGVFELRFGPYRPNVDSDLGGATPYEDAFGTTPSFSIGIEGSWQVLRIPYLGTLGPGIGVHQFRKKGIAEFTSGSTGSAHTNSLWILPMYGVGVLRIDVLAKELKIPLVPYIKGGLAFALWESRDAGSLSVDNNGTRARGSEFGLQVQGGIMFLLDPLQPQWAIDMDNSTGINHTYLFAEWWMSDVNSFGTGMQVGTSTWVVGLALEF